MAGAIAGIALVLFLFLGLPLALYRDTIDSQRKALRDLMNERNKIIESSKVDILVELKKGNDLTESVESYRDISYNIYSRRRYTVSAIERAKRIVSGWSEAQAVTITSSNDRKIFPMHRVSKIIICESNVLKWEDAYKDTDEFKERLEEILEKKHAKKLFDKVYKGKVI